MGIDMKVLIIPWNLYPENAGGAGKSIYYTARGLAKLSEISEVHILTSTIGDTRVEKEGKLRIERYNDLDIKFRTGEKPFGFENVKRKLGHLKIYKKWENRIKEKYEKFRPDIIHCNDPFSLRKAKKALKGIKVPIVVSVRGLWPSSSTGTQLDNKGRIIEKWKLGDTLRTHKTMFPLANYKFYKNKRNLKEVSGIHFVSKYTKGKAEEHMLLDSVKKVIMNPRPIPKKERIKKQNQKTIAYVGELTYKKGLHKLLEALKILIDENRDYYLLVAGVGPMEKKFKKFVKNNNLEKNVTFLGWVDNPDQVYQNTVVTIVPSLWPDPLPGVAFEPMFNDNIPLVSKYGGMPEIVPLKELVVNVENPKELANKIEEIIENPKKQKEIRKTFKSWLQKFSVETAAKQFFLFYKEVIENFKKDKK
jgi:glycosyltransferase involved in cell wall biosynthesis